MDFNTVGIITKFYGHIKISVTLVNAIFVKNTFIFSGFSIAVCPKEQLKTFSNDLITLKNISIFINFLIQIQI